MYKESGLASTNRKYIIPSVLISKIHIQVYDDHISGDHWNKCKKIDFDIFNYILGKIPVKGKLHRVMKKETVIKLDGLWVLLMQ